MSGRKYFGNAAHLIVGSWCRFHLATSVDGFLVSTVGEYWPERSSREITASIEDPHWLDENRHRKGDDFDHAYRKRFGYTPIGAGKNSLYETMVFPIGGECECGCGLPVPSDWSCIDSTRYATAKEATAGHEAFCVKYERKAKPKSQRGSSRRGTGR